MKMRSDDEFEGAEFQRLLELRREVLGDAYVDRAMASADPVSVALQRIITMQAWSSWDHEALSLREQSLIVLGIVAALGREQELALHMRTGLRLGLEDGTVTALIHKITAYCGAPAGLAALRCYNLARVETNDA
jgi:4-carboxymuconolactone decarboxylase